MFLVSDGTPNAEGASKWGTAGTSACHWEEPFGHIWTKVPGFTEFPVPRPSSRVARWWKIEQKDVTFCTLRSKLKLFLEDIFCKTFLGFYLNPVNPQTSKSAPGVSAANARQGVPQMDYSSGLVVTRQLGSKIPPVAHMVTSRNFPWKELSWKNVENVGEFRTYIALLADLR